jgi:signal transduction histidine kinase
LGVGPGLRLAADIALGLVITATLVFQASQIAESWGGDSWMLDFGAGALGGAITPLRRRAPFTAALAGLTIAAAAIVTARFAHQPDEPSPALALSLSVLVGSAVRRLPTPRAGVIAAAGFAVAAGSAVAAHANSALGIGAITVLNLAAWIAALAVGSSLRLFDTRRRDVAERVRRDERLELARELHDVVAHHITGIVLQAQAAQLIARKRAASPGQPEPLGDALADIEVAGADALAAMRRVVGLLRDTDDAAPATSGPERLSDLIERFSGQGPSTRRVDLRLPDGEAVGPPEVTNTVYRVVQESLTNIARHAPHARAITVSVARDQDRRAVVVEVADDAAPLSARPHLRGGYGLVGMRERVEALGGALRAGPLPGAGWSVLATLPLPTEHR